MGQGGPDGQADRDQTGSAERRRLAHDRGDSPEHRAEESPTIAAAIAVPIVCPRRSAGASPTSHASPAVQASALPNPWMKRETSRTTIESPVANTNVATAIVSKPAIDVARAPKRAVAIPPGRLPTSAPSG